VARIFITGSADGLGLLAARGLITDGHDVTLHGRSAARGEEALAAAPGAAGVLIADLASVDETCALADAANAAGHFDAVIHNAGVGYQRPRRGTVDGLEHVFAINVLAPYLLTALMDRADRLVYLSSGMHTMGRPDFDDLQWERRAWNGSQAYADSKLLDAALAAAVARHWPDVAANAVNPGWVATKMGGAGAPDDLEAGWRTQAWLATASEAADVSGNYLYHRRSQPPSDSVGDVEFQDRLLAACAELTGVTLTV
jgi:NAD(P)-dependent dehydrogenase (short-subunit alcohol dehydrogenase family)